MGKEKKERADTALTAQNTVAQSQVDIANRQQDLGESIWKDTAPAREFATNTYMGLAKGNVPGIEKYTAPSINAATSQFYMARKSVESMPPGAQRDAAMRDINSQEAATKTGIYSGSVADATARVASMGWGGVGMTTGLMGGASAGYGSAASIYGSQAESYNQQASQKGGMAGSGIAAAGSITAALV
jgi:hypothetical protein